VKVIPILVTLFVFAALHTFSAGRFKPVFRRYFGERVYEGLYRVVYNIFALISFLPVLVFMMSSPSQIIWTIPSVLIPLFLVIQFTGLIGLLVSLAQIDFWRFAGLRQLWTYINHQPLPLPDEPLQTNGVFRLVRHPLYLFSMITIWAVTTMTDTYLAFCIGVTLYFIIGSVLEERRLEAAFGETYREYRRRVPWLLPFPRPSTNS
jgi:methanethiol S-methyltransferase